MLVQAALIFGVIALALWYLSAGKQKPASNVESSSSAVKEKEDAKAAKGKASTNPKKGDGKAELKRKDATAAGGPACAFSFKGHTGAVTHMRFR